MHVLVCIIPSDVLVMQSVLLMQKGDEWWSSFKLHAQREFAMYTGKALCGRRTRGTLELCANLENSFTFW